MENEAGRAPAETGSREPEPAVPALSGFDPSRVMAAECLGDLVSGIWRAVIEQGIRK